MVIDVDESGENFKTSASDGSSSGKKGKAKKQK